MVINMIKKCLNSPARGSQGYAGRDQRVPRHGRGSSHRRRERRPRSDARRRRGRSGHAPEYYSRAAVLRGGSGEDGEYLPRPPQRSETLHRLLQVGTSIVVCSIMSVRIYDKCGRFMLPPECFKYISTYDFE